MSLSSPGRFAAIKTDCPCFFFPEYRFSSENPNVVHMSVKPAELLEDDEAGKGKSSSSGGRNNEGGSGCCVIL